MWIMLTRRSTRLHEALRVKKENPGIKNEFFDSVVKVEGRHAPDYDEAAEVVKALERGGFV